jgi:2-acylglycerol O-acyltransferase 2
MIIYFIYIIFIDKSPVTGGSKREWVRRLSFFGYFRDYFPLELHKTAELPATKTYVFGYHPHGIIGMGAFGNFATEASNFSEKFPGIDLRLLTLSVNFRTPFYREYLLSLGVCDVSRKSCDNILGKGPGNAILIVVGGAAEALDSHPGSFDLTLGNRKGFIKVALTNGSDLVPVISFGETDLYYQVANPKGSRLREFQHKLQKVMGFSFPLVKGRGIFNYDYGLLPHRRPINTIVGKPIPCPKIDNPTNEDIDKYHQIYITELTQLFEEHKQKYSPDSVLRVF